MRRIVLVLGLAALLAPAGAAAHATLVRTQPSNGQVVQRAPSEVRIRFDDRIRAAGGNAVVRNDGAASVLAGPARARGRELVLPLRRGLENGAYSVRWSVVSDDGHREQGVLAFGVGGGTTSPRSVLGAPASTQWSDFVLRALFFLGVLAAAGASGFWLLTRGLLGDRMRAPLAHLLFFALLAAFLGGSGMLHDSPGGTRFSLVLKVAVTVALAGGAAAALAPTVPSLLLLAGGCSLALLVLPTLAGHALDRDQPRVLAALVDLAHISAAALWLGGLLALVYVVPRASADAEARTAAARRFSRAALLAVVVLGAAGAGRAVTELNAVDQLWTTGYGRALLVKTALVVPLLALGWLNRTLLIGAFARLRRSAFVEIALLLVVVAAVAVLTEIRPGTATRAAAAAPALAQPPALPPREAVVEGRELGSLALAVARTGGRVQVTVLGPDGTGLDGRRVTVDGAPALPCGSGCYRARSVARRVRVAVDGSAVTFDAPPRAPAAGALLARVTRAMRASRTIVFDEQLASSPANKTTSRFEVVAPDRLSYVTGSGAAGIVIGARRWDRERPGAPWVRSGQTPLDVTAVSWRAPTNVHLIAPNVLTFLDRRIPAWFRVTIAAGRPARAEMTSAAHFMVDRYVGFDVPVEISPPPSR